MTSARPASTFLAVGLGNPGRSFRGNRPNVGFMVIDLLGDKCGGTLSRLRSKALVGECRFDRARLILAKPQTYMNRSGQSVAPLARFYRLPLSHTLIIFDDLDLPLGSLRLRPEGGSGGHHGMESIIASLGTSAFPRLRIGIGRPPGRMDPTAYVLQDFGKSELEEVAIALQRAADAVQAFVEEGLEAAMNRFNTQVLA